MARELKLGRESLRKLVRSDLGLKLRERRIEHHLTTAQKMQGLLRRLAQIPDDKILFSDEKLFTIEESSDRQNDRILAYSSNSISNELRFIDRVQRPLSIMVWTGVSADSRTNLIFIPRGVRINTETYKEMILEAEIKDPGQKLFNNEPWLFQQDLAELAPAHASKETKSWLQGQNIDFLTKEE